MGSINRKELVSRHNPCLLGWNPATPLSLGNGDFTFTADCTGLQSFVEPVVGGIPCTTMSQWGLHSYPSAAKDDSALLLQYFQAGTRQVGYMTDPTGQQELFEQLRINPHRFNLARIGLCMDHVPISKDDVLAAHQYLDLYQGMLSSTFKINKHPVQVKTVCHPSLDMLSCTIESKLLSRKKLGLTFAFPYPSHLIDGSDWNEEQQHQTTLEELGRGIYRFIRIVDDCSYQLTVRFSCNLPMKVEMHGEHCWEFTTTEPSLEVSILFSATEYTEEIPLFVETANQAKQWWQAFWQNGAALSLWGSKDLRALELERRVILSQYLTAIQCLGSLPPAETGLTCNSWYGKFHLEMHVWHAAQAVLWNRSHMLEKSLSWYSTILKSAQQRAQAQGYQGARWPKMTDPSGRDSPSTIGPLLCWQQPHLIYLAELLYRNNPSVHILETYAPLVFESALFMADYPLWDNEAQEYLLAPPLIPAQENHRPEDTCNPTFELEYWRWGLETASKWKQRLGQQVPFQWRKVAAKLSPCPIDKGGNRYAAHQQCLDTYGKFATDHPSFLLAYGFLPGLSIDKQKMSNSFDAVLRHWHFETMWGWDFPTMAMTLARLGLAQDAVDILLMNSPKNIYLPNGHNRQGSVEALPLYLPGNGGLLLAIAMMAGGWDGSEGEAPGFPKNGEWQVTSEGLGVYI